MILRKMNFGMRMQMRNFLSMHISHISKKTKFRTCLEFNFSKCVLLLCKLQKISAQQNYDAKLCNAFTVGIRIPEIQIAEIKLGIKMSVFRMAVCYSDTI